MDLITKSRSISPDNEQCLKERYRSYSRVEGYVKHMNNAFYGQMQNNALYDEVHEKISRFRTQTPLIQSKFKVSHFPSTKFENLSFKKENDTRSQENRFKTNVRQRSKKYCKVKRNEINRISFLSNQKKISMPEKCSRCFKVQCSCNKLFKNSFLKNILRKNADIKLKFHHHSPSPESKSGSSLLKLKSVYKSESLAAELLKHQKCPQKEIVPLEKALKIFSIKSFCRDLKQP